jgi:cellulose biosynthesis protein BcsQ
MISFGLYNSKGGVGKTAAAVNLSFLAASEGMKTLLLDLDPQASSTFYCRVRPKIKGGAASMVRREHKIDYYIKHTQYEKLDLLPSDFSTRKLDIVLNSMKKSRKQLGKSVKKLSGHYEVVFIDSPPAFSLISENIILASDFILFPMIPTTLSMRTYEQVLRYFEKRGIEFSKIIPFFSMVDRRKKGHRDMVEEFTYNQSSFLRTAIPYSSEVEKMGVHCAPLPAYSPHGKTTETFRELWAEIKRRAFPRDYRPPYAAP